MENITEFKSASDFAYKFESEYDWDPKYGSDPDNLTDSFIPDSDTLKSSDEEYCFEPANVSD
jgi:hypothetical protein